MGMRSHSDPLHVSTLESRDPTRRASLHLLVEGLDAEVEGKSARALRLYEDALRIDPGNGFAYLVIARHHAEQGDARRALSFLDQANAFLGSQRDVEAKTQAHMLGIRGMALVASGDRADAKPLFARARELAPGVWADSMLTADELR